MSNKNFSSFENLVNLFTSIGNVLNRNKTLVGDTIGWFSENLIGRYDFHYSSDGNAIPDGEFKYHCCSPLIKVNEGDIFTASKKTALSSSNNMWLYKYDSSKTFISSVQVLAGPTLSNDFTVPSGVSYIAVDLLVGVQMTPAEQASREIMFYRKDTLSSYKPYHDPVEEELDQISAIANAKVSESLLYDTAGLIGKNLLNISAEVKTKTYDGITMTVFRNIEGGIIKINLNGTATSNVTFNFIDPANKFAPEPGTYIHSRGPRITDDFEVFLDAWNGRSTRIKALANLQTVNEKQFTIDYDGYDRIREGVYIPNGKTINEDVYPMLRHASIIDNTYEPYHPSIKQTLRDNMVLASKNLLHIFDSVKSQILNGITFTVNRNSYGEVISIIANGTATTNFSIDLAQGDFSGLVLSGCPEAGSASTFKLSYIDIDHTTNQYNDFGSGVSIPLSLPSIGRWTVRLVFYNGCAANNLSFKPMICTTEEWNKSKNFVPYHNTLDYLKANRKELKDTIGWSCKNEIPFPYNGLKTSMDIDLSVNADGIINLNGTQGSSAQGQYYLSRRFNYDFRLPAGTYILTGGNTSNKVWLDVGVNNVTGDASQGSTTLGQDKGNGFTFTLNKLSDIQLILFVDKNAVLSNTKIYPMIRKAEIIDDTFEPHHESVDVIKANRNEVRGTIGWSCKNLIGNPEFTEGNYRTIQTDNSVKFNGTPSSDLFYNYGKNKNNPNYNHIIPVEAGKKYIISGCPSGGMGTGAEMPSTYGIRCYAQVSDDTLRWLGTDYGNGVEVTIPDNVKYVFVQIAIKSGTVLSDTIFYPMIRRADIADDTYEPYHESVEFDHEEKLYGVNLLDINLKSTTLYGVTFKRNTDNTITINGTASDRAMPSITDPFILPIGDYVFSGVPDGANPGTNTGHNMFISETHIDGSAITYHSLYNGEIIISVTSNTKELRAYINAWKDSNADNLIMKPMLYKAELGRNISYRQSNLQSIQHQLNNQSNILGVKNLLENTHVGTAILYGLTITRNSDDSITVNGTATDNVAITINNQLLNKLDPNKTYIFSGAPKTATEQTYFTYVGYNPGNGSFAHEYGEGAKFRLNSLNVQYTNITYYIFVRSGAVLDNVVFKPMIRLASDSDSTYVPHAMTNRELTTVQESAFTDIISGASVSPGTGGNYIEKQGKIVIAQLGLASVTIGSWTGSVAKIPEGFRPKHNVWFVDHSGNKGAVLANGNIQFETALSNKSIAFQLTWVTK